jgi:cell division control protein 6
VFSCKVIILFKPYIDICHAESVIEFADHGVRRLRADRVCPTSVSLPTDRAADTADLPDADAVGNLVTTDFEMFGILDRTKQNEGRAGGIYYEYEVDVPLNAVLSTLENLHMSDELDLESLRENVRENGLI